MPQKKNQLSNNNYKNKIKYNNNSNNNHNNKISNNLPLK